MATQHPIKKYSDLPNYIPTYQSWRGMKERCFNPKNSHYKYYGALGISVCDSWADSKEGFRNFYNDMGERPDGMTLDRINVKENYSKENCRWADLTTQAYNTNREHLNKTGRIGVGKKNTKTKESWYAFITYRWKRIHLGTFDNYDDACKAREKAELEYYGVTK